MFSTRTAWMRLQSYPGSVKFTLAVYAFAFLLGTSVHLNSLLHGWWFHHHPFVNTYWTALTFLDPLAVFLLLRSPRLGLLLALAIMLTDVGINSFVTYLYFDADGHYAVDHHVQLQTAFLGFVLGSAPFLWAHLRYKSAA